MQTIEALEALAHWLLQHAVAVMATSIALSVVVDGVLARVNRRFDGRSTLTSVLAGLVYISGKGLATKLVFFGLAMWIYEHHRLLDLPTASVAVWGVMFVCRDFVYYWIHRAEHRFAGLWASHMIHHSPEKMSVTTAVRMPWMEVLYKPLLGMWVPLLGFHPAAFAAIGALVLAAGQLQHTELMRRRTVLDLVFVTPSTHRVHHASNTRYLDKNFGSMLVIWDRLFGTYEPETEKVRYGLTGSKQLSTLGGAFTGGYPALLRRMATSGSVAAAGRALFARPS